MGTGLRPESRASAGEVSLIRPSLAHLQEQVNWVWKHVTQPHPEMDFLPLLLYRESRHQQQFTDHFLVCGLVRKTDVE